MNAKKMNNRELGTFLVILVCLVSVMSPAMTQSSIPMFSNTGNATKGEADDISEPTTMPSPPSETTPVLSPTPEHNSGLSPTSNQTQTSTPSPSPSPTPTPTPTQTRSHASPASTIFVHSSPVLDADGSPRTLNTTTNQSVNVSRSLNCTEVFNQSNVTRSSYTNASAMTGTWNVSTLASNENSTDMQTGSWNVSDEQATPAHSPTLHINKRSLNVTESSDNETQALKECNTNLTTDLAVTSIELETGCGASEHPCFRYAGYALNVTATIANLGVADASDFVVTFRDESSQFDETEVSHLPAGSPCSVNATWDLSDVDIKRQNIMPLLHILPEAVDVDGKVTMYNFALYGMDLVDFNKLDVRKDIPQPSQGTDNTQDVLNDILIRMSKAMSQYKRGDAYSEGIQSVDIDSYTPFLERFENLLAGWELSVSFEIFTGDEIC